MIKLKRVGDRANHWVWRRPIPWLQLGVLALACLAAAMLGVMG